MLDRLGRAAKAAALAFRSAPIEAGGTGRRASPVLRRPAAEIGAKRETASARAAWLAMNSPHAAALVSAWVSNVVADGPSVRPNTQNAELRRALIAGWSRFWTDADADGLGDFGLLLSRAFRGVVVDGETFVQLLAGPDGAVQLRVLSPRQVDASLSRPLANGGRIVHGVEIDAAGRRAAYWVRPADDEPFAATLQPIRVVADDIAHVFDPVAPGQVRGLSWLAPVATRLVEIDRLEDALLAKFNTAALFAGIVTREADIGSATGGEVADGVEVSSLEPGAMLNLPAGTDIKFSNPPSSEGSADFLRAMQRSAAAGGGVPYELLTHDLSQLSYSSARVGLMEFRRRVISVQKNLLVAQLLAKVWRRFAVLEVIAGRLPAEAMTVDAAFIFPGWAQLDPVKETNADVTAVDHGFKSRAEVVSGRGRDLEEVDVEITADTFRPAKEPVNA
jgi:lambda family phage portal protein